ncbi:quinone oxidoreductase family protein [Herpetosiphon llansteffanensis]
MKAIQIQQFGAADVLSYTDVEQPKPKPGEILVRNQATGVNFVDIYQRSGRVAGIALPAILGMEGAGVIAELGAGVEGWEVGMPVAYVNIRGAYAEYINIPAERLIRLPAGIEPTVATAVLEQGITAHYLAHDSYPIKAGDTVLVHAGTGGTGLLLTQMAKQLGATVITTVSTEAKAQLSYQAGADQVIVYADGSFAEAVLAYTQQRGVAAVYDSVGAATFEQSLKVLQRRGTLVLFGASSGPAPAFDPQRLAQGSYHLTRPAIGHFIVDAAELAYRSNAVFDAILAGSLSLHRYSEYSLAEAAQAHQALEQRQTTGKLVLLPN